MPVRRRIGQSNRDGPPVYDAAVSQQEEITERNDGLKAFQKALMETSSDPPLLGIGVDLAQCSNEQTQIDF